MADAVTPPASGGGAPPAGGLPPGLAAMGAAPPDPEKIPLLPLREDIRLLPGPETAGGEPTWTLQDPAAHRFFRISWADMELLTRWGLGTTGAVVASVRRETTLRPAIKDVLELMQFLENNNLLRVLGTRGEERFLRVRRAQKLSPGMWLLKNYLFIRVRLFNPDPLLQKMLPWLGWLFHPWYPLLLLGLIAVGGYLVTRQWESFMHSLPDLLTPEGMVLSALVLSLTKIVHEFGHGLTTRYYGGRVPSMGVALLVMFPVLWTDTTEAWKLTNRRQRLVIDSAGMLAELMVAAVAAIVWAMLPNGPLRSSVFLLVSSTWIVTLTVNLNPFMRFDGYFILSDLLDIPNLQDRAFAYTRWWLRETLFALGDPRPESFPAQQEKLIIAYAFATWTYRFFLFMGIALLVYHVSFKLLGLFLMGVEVWWFIARPVVGELMIWNKRRKDVRLTRQGWSALGLLGLGLGVLLLPWNGTVSAPALLKAARQSIVMTASAGRLVQWPGEGKFVREGEPLYVLDSPDLLSREAELRAQVAGLQERLNGMSFDPAEVANIELYWQDLQRSRAELESLASEQAGLIVRAPFSGVMVDLPSALRRGLWMQKREPVGMLLAPGPAQIESYLAEADFDRVHPGAEGTFYPENGESPVPVRVVAVSPTATRELDTPELVSSYGGPIPVRAESRSKLVPENALFRVMLVAETGEAERFGGAQTVPPALRRGAVVMQADRTSPLHWIWRRVAAVVVRESGL